MLKRLANFLFRPLPILILLLVIVSATSVFFILQYRKAQAQLQQLTSTQTKAEIDKLVKTVGKLVELPGDEQPTVATVTDKSKLQDQPFFSKAENDDKVLIYTNNKRAILFRPSKNKIIDITSLNALTPEAQQTQASPAQARIALYNGSQTAGLTSLVADKLKKDFAQTTVTVKANAAKNDYTQTTIVDLTGTNSQLAQQLATSFNAKVGTLPAGEAKPDADILMVLSAPAAQP